MFPRTGHLEWIGIARARRAPVDVLASAVLESGTGIEGEHHASGGRSKRQVTLIQFEHLDVVARLLGRECIEPELLRRNLVVSGINLLALQASRFRVGDVVLQGTGPCDPCSRMEENLGPGGYNAMLGHGGITTRVVRIIHTGEPIIVEEETLL